MQILQPNTTLQGGKYRIVRVLGQGDEKYHKSTANSEKSSIFAT